MRRLTVLAALLVLTLGVGCKDQSPPPPSIAGHWTGAAATGLAFDLTLIQNGRTVSGLGLVGPAGSMSGATVDGSYDPPNVTLFISRANPQDLGITGTHSGAVITGQVVGVAAITLTRQ